MSLLILFPAILAALAIAVAVGAWMVRGRMLLPSDHARLNILASELYSQARIESMTRATAQAMRDSVREYQRQGSVR